MFLAGNKDIHEVLLFLKIAKRFLQRKSKLKVCKMKERQNRTESVKNRPAGSKWFFRGTYATLIKKSEQTPESQLYRARCRKNSDQKDDLVILYEFFYPRTESVSCTARHNFWTFLQSEAILGTKIWKAKIQWWCYWVTTSRHNKSKINLFMWVASQKRFLLCL